tara:strand:+ start:117173 stop:117289 length:117 start_codon:yes stop_codon:yes gene_type:complete
MVVDPFAGMQKMGLSSGHRGDKNFMKFGTQNERVDYEH